MKTFLIKKCRGSTSNCFAPKQVIDDDPRLVKNKKPGLGLPRTHSTFKKQTPCIRSTPILLAVENESCNTLDQKHPHPTGCGEQELQGPYRNSGNNARGLIGNTGSPTHAGGLRRSRCAGSARLEVGARQEESSPTPKSIGPHKIMLMHSPAGDCGRTRERRRA